MAKRRVISTASSNSNFAGALVAWFNENHRSLPWRETYDPYHVWISEVMLQQTQVETALPYYERFISTFPNVQRLAIAPDEQVLTLWAGLGYYSRARNLMAAARLIVSEHAGAIPSDYDALRALPGIGRYMAGAILSIAFNKPYPIVDGNVRRVLSRINGWTEENTDDLWNAAAAVVERAEPRTVNQAIMELGAKVCSFRSPRCLLCPIHDSCIAFRTGMQTEIPKARKRPETIRLHLFAIVHSDEGRYLMKCSKGFWEFPMFSGPPPDGLTRIGECRHTVTHHRMDITVCTGFLEDITGLEWQRPASVPVSSLTRKILSIAAPQLC